jgi:hypothetical protein
MAIGPLGWFLAGAVDPGSERSNGSDAGEVVQDLVLTST